MTNNIKGILTTLWLFFLSLSPNVAYSADSIIQITGYMRDNTFMIPGSTSKWYPVDLELRNCPIGTTSIEATFTGLDDSTGYYRNQGSAKNLHLELQDTAGNKLRNGSKKVVEVGEYSFAAIFPLRVRAISVNGRPTQGSVQAIINVTYVFM
ncbi:type 1 fimbrial protein [Proteus mirabilis]|nr:type 1 fimbrial protein [Proteus mirabilis]HEK0666816.1 type 1 fimbrial protein [Proteus mirabilis]